MNNCPLLKKKKSRKEVPDIKNLNTINNPAVMHD